jgi:hypothetical protein
MLGFDAILYPVARKQRDSGSWRKAGRGFRRPSRLGTPIAEWNVSWNQTRWLDDLIEQDLARQLCWNGYPLAYAVSVAGLKSKLEQGIPARGIEKLQLTPEALGRLDRIGDSTWIYLEMWDQS